MHTFGRTYQRRVTHPVFASYITPHSRRL